ALGDVRPTGTIRSGCKSSNRYLSALRQQTREADTTSCPSPLFSRDCPLWAVHHFVVIRCYRFQQQRWSRGLDARGLGHTRCIVGGGAASPSAAFPLSACERLDR